MVGDLVGGIGGILWGSCGVARITRIALTFDLVGEIGGDLYGDLYGILCGGSYISYSSYD